MKPNERRVADGLGDVVVDPAAETVWDRHPVTTFLPSGPDRAARPATIEAGLGRNVRSRNIIKRLDRSGKLIGARKTVKVGLEVDWSR
jgi:predicted phosphatase